MLTLIDSATMHIIACGIICHQNWRIGPSLEAEGVDSYGLKVKCFLLINETMLVNIVEVSTVSGVDVSMDNCCSAVLMKKYDI